ncbi:MAG: hypothetical protein V4547_16340 [Bacteroidota bacterium]
MGSIVKLYKVIVIGILLASNRVANFGEELTESQIGPNFAELLKGKFIEEAGEKEVEVEETKAGEEFSSAAAAAEAAENAGLKIGEVTEEPTVDAAVPAADADTTDAAAENAAAADVSATNADAVIVDGVATNMQFVTAKGFIPEDSKIDELKNFAKEYGGVELEGGKRPEVLASFLVWANSVTV